MIEALYYVCYQDSHAKEMVYRNSLRLQAVSNYFLFSFLRCWSYVGRTGRKQQLSLAKGCWQKGTIAHELGADPNENDIEQCEIDPQQHSDVVKLGHSFIALSLGYRDENGTNSGLGSAHERKVRFTHFAPSPTE